MTDPIFILDHSEAGLDAATARRQFFLSIAVGFAVLAVAALIALHPARSAPIGVARAHAVDYALVATTARPN